MHTFKMLWAELKSRRPAGSRAVVFECADAKHEAEMSEFTIEDKTQLRGTLAWILLRFGDQYAEPWGLVPYALLHARKGQVRRVDCVKEALPQQQQQYICTGGMPTVDRDVNMDEVRDWCLRRLALYARLEQSQALQLDGPEPGSTEDVVGYLVLMRASVQDQAQWPTDRRAAMVWQRGEAALSLQRLVWGQLDTRDMAAQAFAGGGGRRIAGLEYLFGELGTNVCHVLGRMVDGDTGMRMREGMITAPVAAWTRDLHAWCCSVHTKNLAHMRQCDVRTGHTFMDRLMGDLKHQMDEASVVTTTPCQVVIPQQASCDMDELVRLMPGCMHNLHQRAVQPGGGLHLKHEERGVYAAYMVVAGADADSLLAVQTHPRPQKMAQAIKGAQVWVRREVEAGMYRGGTSCKTMADKGLCPLHTGDQVAALIACKQMYTKVTAKRIARHPTYPSLYSQSMRRDLAAKTQT